LEHGIVYKKATGRPKKPDKAKLGGGGGRIMKSDSVAKKGEGERSQNKKSAKARSKQLHDSITRHWIRKGEIGKEASTREV